MKTRTTHGAEFSDAPTLGELLEALTKIRDAGASLDATLTITLGDKGNQRDPWHYLRGISVTTEATS